MHTFVLNISWDAIQNKPFFFSCRKKIPAEQKLGVEESAEKQRSGGLWFRCSDNHLSWNYELQLSRAKSTICSCDQRGGSAAEGCTTWDFSADQAATSEVTQNLFWSWQVLCLGKVWCYLLWGAMNAQAVFSASQSANSSWRNWLVQQMVKYLVEPEPYSDPYTWGNNLGNDYDKHKAVDFREVRCPRATCRRWWGQCQPGHMAAGGQAAPGWGWGMQLPQALQGDTWAWGGSPTGTSACKGGKVHPCRFATSKQQSRSILRSNTPWNKL